MSALGFGEILNRYRVDAGLSQSRLAELAGLSAETIGALERGTRRAPYRATVDALAKALRIGSDGRLELLAGADRSRARTFAKDAPAEGALAALPRQLTACIGRTREIADILGLLDEARIVTVTGPAGIGKTRILSEVAGRLPAPRREAVRFVDLSALESGDYLLSSIAVSCGGSAAAHSATIADFTNFLRPQSLLLLLDNCEHLVEHVALAAATITRNCPDVAILATSRERLAIAGETLYRLPSLSSDAALALMLERIAALDADFAASDDDAPALADICGALDRIPLAIELAAARVQTLGIRAVRERLSDGLSLSGGARDLPARQRTMVAAIAWSYSLLDDRERRLINRLSVFSGGFTLEAAESVGGVAPLEREQVPDLVLSLVDKSLVDVHLVAETVRYAMLETIRAFTRDRLAESAETASAMQRHAEWYGNLAEHVTSTQGKTPPTVTGRKLDPEMNNVRAALQWSLGSGGDPVLAGRIVAGLRQLWRYQYLHAERVRWAKAALAQLDEAQVPGIASRLLTTIVQSTQGVAVEPWIQRAIAVTALTGDRGKLFELERALAHHYFFLGKINQADEAAARAASILEQDGLLRQAGHAGLLSIRVWIRVEQGRLADARADASTGEAIHVALGEAEPLNWWLTRAYLSYAGDDMAEALRLITVIIDRALVSPTGYGEELFAAYAYLALFRISTGDMDEARAAAREVLMRTRERTDYWPCTAIALLAVVAAHRDGAHGAARLLGFVESWHRSQPYLPTIAQRQTMELLRSAVVRRIGGDAVEAFVAEGKLMELRAAIARALEI